MARAASCASAVALVCVLALATTAIALGGSGSIGGTVRATGSPVAGITVEAVTAFGGEDVARTTTGADGTYRLDVPDNVYHVYFVPPETSPYARQIYYLQTGTIGATNVTISGNAMTGIDAQLRPARQISGTVVDAVTGSGIPRVNVVVYIAGSACCYGATSVITGAGGTYAAKVPDDVYRVQFVGSGYPTQWWPKLNVAVTLDGWRMARDITVAGADVSGIDATLGASGVQRSCFDPAVTPTATVYLPNITKTLGGPSGWVTPFIVQNVGAAGTALEVSFYGFTDGVRVSCRRIENLQPGTSFADVPNNDADLPGDSQFSVVVRSYGSNVVSVANEHQGSGTRAEALSYVGLQSGAPTVYLPYLTKGYRDWLTTFIVQNLGAATANVTIALTSLDGARTATITRTIAPGRSAAIDPSVEASIARFDELSGIVMATQPVAVVVNAHNDAPTVAAPKGYSYNGVAASGATSTYMPYLLKEDLEAAGPGAGQVYVQNMGSADATPTLTFRKLGTTTTVAIAAPGPVRPGATWSFDPQIYKISGGYQLCRTAGAGRCIEPGEHSLVVSGGSFAVVNAMVSSATALGVIGTSTTATKYYLPNVTRTLGGASGWTTPVVIQSAGAASATVRWYRFTDGSLAYTQVLTALTAGASAQLDPRSLPALADDTQYALVVEGDGPLAALVRELNFSGGDGAMGYEGFAAAT